jgi:hypothetical protein
VKQLGGYCFSRHEIVHETQPSSPVECEESHSGERVSRCVECGRLEEGVKEVKSH